MRVNSFFYGTLTMALLGVMVVPTSAQRLTLPEAVDIAWKNNERIHQFEERLEQKQYDRNEAWGNFLPSLSFNGSYNRMNAPLEMDLSGIREALIQIESNNQVSLANLKNVMTTGLPLSAAAQQAVYQSAQSGYDAALPSFSEVLKKQDYKDGYFLGVQPIFLGGKLLAAKRYASSELQSAEIELKKTKDEVTQETIANYLAVVLLNDVVNTRENVLAGMQKHQADAKRLLDAGLIATHQELRAEVAVAEAERNLFDDQNKRTLALIALKNTLGLPELDPVEVTDSLTFIDIPDSLNVFLVQAQHSNPILQIIAQKKNAASQKFNAERAEFLPQVAAFGKYEIFPQDLMVGLEPHWIVGVQVSINLFNGFKKYSRLESASHLEREVEFIEADAQKKIGLLVNKNYSDMTNSRNRYFKLQTNRSLASENLRLMDKRFQTGLSTSLDVIDAQLIYEKDEVESKNSLFDYYRSMTELFASIGQPEKVIEIWKSKEK
ncbi:MAG TPA: TolC family protein [Bacteroidota bacterium]|nr:TolC family protein [Bacteroidota bacterium]